ncbi:MAG: PIN domain-containing protein [Bacteroidales bacterium]|nr:PIN domain-containing protein [Bacteroidales bacterium]
MRYLLDTNICIFLLRGNREIADRMDSAGFANCSISEITKAELLTGMHYSNMKGRKSNERDLLDFLDSITVIPVSRALDRFAKEKARLICEGRPVEDFDLLIGCSAVVCGCVMVTHNVSHFERIDSIVIEDWKD